MTQPLAGTAAAQVEHHRRNPYVGPRAFTSGEALYGRDRELTRLLHLLIAERIVLLHSPSGAGKTSLIQAGLAPRLEREAFGVLPAIRVSLEPPAPTNTPSNGVYPNRYILSAILSLEEGQPPDQRLSGAALQHMDLASYLGRRCAATSHGPSEWVLLFDQFEEILTVDPTDAEAKTEFFAQIGTALRDRRFWALFALREDYVAALDPYIRPIPTRFHTTLRLDLLSPESARLAIHEPARSVGVAFEDAAADRLIDDLRRVRVQQADGTTIDQPGQYVEPVQLQVVCLRLWDRLPPDATRIVEADIEGVGDVDEALGAYYADRVATVAAQGAVRERAVREWVDTRLITETRIRGQVLQGADSSEGLENAAILALVDAHLVRAERRRGFTWFELAHDRLIDPVKANNAAWFASHLSDLQRQAALWEQQERPPGLLAKGASLARAEQWAREHADELATVEHDFLAASREARRRQRRARMAQVGLIVLAVLATISALVAFKLAVQNQVLAVQWQQESVHAQQESARAQTAETQAVTQRDLARQAGLISMARSEFKTNLDLALLLTLQADANDTPSARAALLDGLISQPHPSAFLPLPRPGGGIIGLMYADENTLISANVDPTDSDGAIRVWNPSTRTQSGEPILQAGLAYVAPSANAAFVALALTNNTIRILDMTTRQVVVEWNPSEEVRSLAISADAGLVATGGCITGGGCESGEARLFKVDLLGRTVAQLGSAMQLPKQVNAVALSPNGPTLAVASEDNVRLTNIATGAISQVPVQVGAQSPPLVGLTYRPDGSMLALGAGHGNTWLWNFGADPLRPTPLLLSGHSLPVERFAFDVPHRRLVGAAADRSITVWSTATGRLQGHELLGHESEVLALAVSPGGTQLASGGSEAAIRLWDVPGDQFAPPSFEPIGRDLPPNLMPRDQVSNRTRDVRQVAISADGARLATLFDNSSVGLWKLPGREKDGPDIAAPGGLSVSRLALSPDGTVIALAGCNEQAQGPQAVGQISVGCQAEVHLTDVRTRQDDALSLRSAGAVFSLLFSPNPDARLLAVGTGNGTIALWDTATHTLRKELSASSPADVRALAFSSDGSTLASATVDGVIDTWDVSSGSKSNSIATRTIIFSIAASPKGDFLASAGPDLDVHVWSPISSAPILLSGHTGAVQDVVFLNDRVLASAGSDRSIRLWDIDGEQQISELQGFENPLSNLAFGHGWLATSSNDSRVPVLDMQSASWRQAACSIAGRNLTPTECTRFVGSDVTYQSICPDQPSGDSVEVAPQASPQLPSEPTVSPLPTPLPALGGDTASGDVPPITCASEPQLRSRQASVTTSLTFVNTGKQNLSVFWLDYSGKRNPYFQLTVDGKVTQPTYVSHPWLVADASGQCLGIYLPLSRPATVRLR